MTSIILDRLMQEAQQSIDAEESQKRRERNKRKAKRRALRNGKRK
jgi:hypothetical protein